MNAEFDDIDEILAKAGLADRVVQTKSKTDRQPSSPEFTPDSQAGAAQAREHARRVRHEWLLKLYDGDASVPDVIRAACTLELSGPLRKLRLDHVLRDSEHERSMRKIHARLSRIYAASAPTLRFCLDKHTRANPRKECTGFHPSQMTIGWLLSPRAQGRRFRAWAAESAAVWEHFPRRRAPEGT